MGTDPRPQPFSFYAALAASPTTPYWARALTRDALRRWGLAPFTETTALLVSELVANAIKASGVDPVRGDSSSLTPPKLIAFRQSEPKDSLPPINRKPKNFKVPPHWHNAPEGK